MDGIPESPTESRSFGRVDAHPVLDAAEVVLPLRDPERLGALLSHLEPRLAAAALRFTRDPDAARDVLQNAFEKVLRHGERFRGNARVSTWIHRIVANEALMWLRTRRRRGEVCLEADVGNGPLGADAAPGPAESLERRERLARLRDGLTQLAPEELDVMRRCALGGQSYAEYARVAGLHPAAVKSRAFRARRRLLALLEE